MLTALGGIAAPRLPCRRHWRCPADINRDSGLRTHPTNGAIPVVVSYGLYISNLANIDEAAETFRIEGYLYSRWRDERLAAPDPAGVSETRALNENAIWLPPLEVANLIEPGFLHETIFGDTHGIVSRVRHFDFLLSEDFNLTHFPLDTQELHLVLQPFMNPGQSDLPMTFASESLATGFSDAAYAGLVGWHVLRVEYHPKVAFVSALNQTVPEAVFEIVVERRSGFYYWKVFIPVFIMVMVSWSIFWVNTEEFDWQMKIPVATMLALVAFEFAIAGDLPRVSYITFLDAVLLTSFIFVFLAMVESVSVHVMIRENRRDLAERVQRGSRSLFPLAYACAIGMLVFLFFVVL
jgi:hypothetical protein